MPPSQLKRLKASLRAEGIVGPQKSKKQKKNGISKGANNEQKAKRSLALQNIREAFNPFEVQAPSRGKEKFEVTNSRTIGGRVTKGVKGRPGVTKGLGEETRKRTLLTEMHRRNKVGGIMDRRFGENDPTMTPEEKMLERFTKEKQRGFKKSTLFDLEGDEEEEQLTHFGQSLSFDDSKPIDDFDEADVGLSDDEDGLASKPSKRRRLSGGEGLDDEAGEVDAEGGLERRKTKAEVMKEVIAKSKLHKYERQQTKDDDEDERERLDKELPSLLALLRGGPVAPRPSQAVVDPAEQASTMNPERAAMLSKHDQATLDKEYDVRLKQMAMDRKAQPTDRTLTEEEKAEKEASRLRELEQRRLRRMKGEVETSDEEGFHQSNLPAETIDEDDDATAFGLGAGLVGQAKKLVLDVEDEDDFILDKDLIASGSETEDSELSASSDDENGLNRAAEEDDDHEFIEDLQASRDHRNGDAALSGANAIGASTIDLKLSYTYPCPQTHVELLQITQSIPHEALPTVIQRIRALYHPKLAADNKAKLGRFAAVLIEHISHLANQPDHPPFPVLETLIRHIHSLAKTHPDEVGQAFRAHLQDIHASRPLAPTPGDLIIYTAIGSIFPTSDHFHPIVTPAILSMTRYLSLHSPTTLSDLAVGTYLTTLCLHYQRISKRYIPECLNYALNALSILAPVKPVLPSTVFPRHEPPTSLRLTKSSTEATRPLQFWDILPPPAPSTPSTSSTSLKLALLTTQLTLLDSFAGLYSSKSAFPDIFSPVQELINHLASPASLSHFPPSIKTHLHRLSHSLNLRLTSTIALRRPLALHHHRPLAIKTSIPKFEDSYSHDKHYDPDRERSESSKLRKEHKRERKGAMRELRKDANFIAREGLREKKERDKEYEKKYRRLVAEIQGEEGREGKGYEREKRMRVSERKNRKRK